MRKESIPVQRWLERTKQRCIDAFHGKCGVCGYNRSKKALSFHHVNPEEKSFGISRQFKSWDRLVVELRKCVMLCANCHQELHDNIIELPADIQRFDESFANYKPVKVIVECRTCGNETTNKMFCSNKCRNEHDQKLDWSKINLHELKNKGMSNVQIGLHLGVSDVLIGKKLKAND